MVLDLQLIIKVILRFTYLTLPKATMRIGVACVGLLFCMLFGVRAAAQENCQCNAFTIEQQQKFEQANLLQNLDAAWAAIHEVKTEGSDCCIAIAHTMEAILLNTIGQFDSSLDSAKAAFRSLGTAQHEYLQLEGNRMIGLGYNRRGQADSAMLYYLRSLETAEKRNKMKFLPKLYANISTVYIYQKQHHLGLVYQKRSLQSALAVADTMSSAQAYANLVTGYGSLYEETGNRAFLDSANSLLDTSIQFARYSKLPLLLMRNYLSKTKFELADDHYSTALAYSDSVLQLTNKKTNPLIFFSVYLDQGNSYLGLRQTRNAIRCFEQALSITEESGHAFTQYDVFEKLWQAYKAEGDADKALYYLERHKALSDSLISSENARTIGELEKKYNQAKNESMIRELAQDKQLYFLIAIAGILAVAAIAFYVRQQALQHRKNILETEQRLNRARMNPHFFFNALTALQKYALTGADGTAVASNLSKFSHIMRETLESTYKEYVAIEQEMEFLREYLDVQKLRFSQPFSFEISSEPGLEVSELLIPSMIIQPFVENTLEHGFAGISYPGKLMIRFGQLADEVTVEITDNGKGLTGLPKDSNEHISRASQIIKDRIYLLNIKLRSKARFTIDNVAQGSGVEVKIYLPVLYRR